MDGHANNSQKLPLVWVGDVKSASDSNFLKKNHIELVINVSEYDFYKKYDDVFYVQFDLKENNDPLTVSEFTSYVNKVTTIIRDYILKGKSVLLHSTRGYQRAPAVYVAYLIRFHNCELGEAIGIAKSLDEYIFHPNVLFMEPLVKLCIPKK